MSLLRVAALTKAYLLCMTWATAHRCCVYIETMDGRVVYISAVRGKIREGALHHLKVFHDERYSKSSPLAYT